MDLKDQLKYRLTESLAKYFEVQGADAMLISDVAVEMPRNPDHGDLATNVAMQLARILKKNPRQIAEELVGHIDKTGLISEMSVASPGFINFRLAGEATATIIENIAEEADAYGRSDKNSDVKALVEFVSANPTGPLHIGHARNAVVGDIVARLLQATGHKVAREYYFNDGGVQMNTLGTTLKLRVAELIGCKVE